MTSPRSRLFLPALSAFWTLAQLHAAPVAIVPPAWPGATQPQVAVAPSGTIHVTFGQGTAIYHVSSSDRGRSFSPPVQVGELPKLALGMRRGPRIAATDAALVITAISHGDGDLRRWFSKDAGQSWQEGGAINDHAGSAREGLHALAGDGRGHVLVTWLDLRNPGMELWRATSSDGGLSWSPNALVYRSPDGHICECCHPSAALQADGTAAVMWRNWLGGARDMFAALSRDHGQTFSTAQKLGTGTWPLEGCPMDGGGVAFDAAGKMQAAWRREKAVFASAADRAEERLAAVGVQPVVVALGDTTATFWESEGGLMLRRGQSAPVRFAEKAHFAAAAPLPKGGAVVVWESAVDGHPTIRAEVLD